MSDQDPQQPPPPPGSEGTPPTHGESPPPAPSGSPPPASDPAATGHGYGGAGLRLLARIIDGLIVGIPLAILFWIIPGIDNGGAVSTVASGVLGFAYFVYFETSSGATPGKSMLNMHVVQGQGATPIPTEASFRRNWWMLLSVISFIPVIGWLAGLASLGIAIAIGVTISSDRQNQGFHDKMAETYVARTA